MYQRRLRALSCQRLRSVYLIPTWLGGVILTGYLTYDLRVLPAFVPPLVGIGLFLFLVLNTLFSAFAKCPRCGKLIFLRGLVGNSLALKCMNCRLPLRVFPRLSQAQGRSLRAWLLSPSPRGPAPDVGLRCPQCAYLLTGLSSSPCPECGAEFPLEAVARDALECARRRPS